MKFLYFMCIIVLLEKSKEKEIPKLKNSKEEKVFLLDSNEDLNINIDCSTKKCNTSNAQCSIINGKNICHCYKCCFVNI